jgi:hypothetical protein
MANYRNMQEEESHPLRHVDNRQILPRAWSPEGEHHTDVPITQTPKVFKDEPYLLAKVELAP